MLFRSGDFVSRNGVTNKIINTDLRDFAGALTSVYLYMDVLKKGLSLGFRDVCLRVTVCACYCVCVLLCVRVTVCACMRVHACVCRSLLCVLRL